MFHNSPTDSRARSLDRNFMARALRPWDMFFNVMDAPENRSLLSALDDHLLKDIGISRGEIDRSPAILLASPASPHRARQPTPTTPNSTKGERP